LSPEQLRNQAVDHRTDIYAFGVVLYQVLSGQLPFTANTFGELVLQIATSTPTPLSELAPELPPGVAEIVSRAMAREPAERFQNLRALIDALRVYADQAFARTTPAAGHPYPVSAGYSTRMATPLATEAKSVPPMASRASRASRPAARSVPVSVQVAVGLIGLVVGAGVWLQFSDHAKPVDSAVPPFIAVPAPVAQAPSAVSPATETAVMAATPASAPVNPDPLAKSAQASASPASGVQHPDAGLAVAEPNAPHVKPARVRALRSDAPARMPVASSPPPSAPAPAIDHNPLHMHIQ
jgi:serine/threonine-protein kinase